MDHAAQSIRQSGRNKRNARIRWLSGQRWNRAVCFSGRRWISAITRFAVGVRGCRKSCDFDRVRGPSATPETTALLLSTFADLYRQEIILKKMF
jgi:hypothetical protein